jgi:ribosomal protein L18E
MDQTQVCYIQNKSTMIVMPNAGNKINQKGGEFIDSEKIFQNNFKLSYSM